MQDYQTKCTSELMSRAYVVQYQSEAVDQQAQLIVVVVVAIEPDV